MPSHKKWPNRYGKTQTFRKNTTTDLKCHHHLENRSNIVLGRAWSPSLHWHQRYTTSKRLVKPWWVAENVRILNVSSPKDRAQGLQGTRQTYPLPWYKDKCTDGDWCRGGSVARGCNRLRCAMLAAPTACWKTCGRRTPYGTAARHARWRNALTGWH